MKAYLIVGFAILCGTPATCLAQGNSETPPAAKSPEYPVQNSAKAGKIDADGWQTIEVTLKVEKDWFLFANPVGNEDLKTSETCLKIAAKNPLLTTQIEYPKGELVADKLIGDYRIYKGTVVLIAKIQRPKGDDAPIEVSATVFPFHLKGAGHWPKKLTMQVR